MKFKPFVKRHWLASQNPYRLELGGLKRVIFTPPAGVVSAEFGAAEEAIELPPRAQSRTLLPDEEELRDVRIRSTAYARELFWVLFSGHDLSATRQPAFALRKISECLEFQFDDGEVLNLPGVFRREGFPIFLDPRFFLTDRNVDWEKALLRTPSEIVAPLRALESQKNSEDFRKAWYMVLEILAWAFERRLECGDLEVVCALPSSITEPRVAYRLDDLEFHKPHPLAATVTSDEAADTARIVVWQGKRTSPPAGILQFFAAGVLGELNAEESDAPEMRQDELEALKEHASEFRWDALFALRPSGSRAIAHELSRLEKILGAKHVLFVKYTLLTGEKFKPRLRVRENENLMEVAVSFSDDALDLRQENFPTSLTAAMRPFLGGLAHYYGVDRKDAASRKAQYRANDLLFLRHQGVCLFTLLELLNWQLHKPLTSGQRIDFQPDLDKAEADQLFERFIEYLQRAIPGLLGKVGNAYQEMFSPEVRAKYYDFVETTYHAMRQDRGVLFHERHMVELRDIHAEVFPLLRFVLLFLVESSGGKILTRSQAPLGERLPALLQQWTVPHAHRASEPENPLWVELGFYNKFVISLLFDLCDQGVDVEFNGHPFLNSGENHFEFKFTADSGGGGQDANWFELHPQIFFDGVAVDPSEVKLNFTPDQVGFIEYRGRIYRIDKKQLPSLKALRRFWNRIHGEAVTSRVNALGQKIFRLQRSQALELLMLKSQGVEIEAKGDLKRIFDYFENGLGSEKVHVPDSMFDTLIPHQREGAQWLHDLYELRLGAILADEMGLGKTFQVLSFLVSLQMREKLGHTLIVVPTSLVYNWVEEKKKFAPHLPLRVFQSAEIEELKVSLSSGEPTVILATYGLVIENPEFFSSVEWTCAVFDEAQNLKNIGSQRSQAARNLKAAFKVCLTGTPMENNYIEFFALCDLVVPGCLGSVESFRRRYQSLEVGFDALQELRLVTRPLLLRRTKSQVKLSLPTKTVQRVLLGFTPKQRDVYKKMALIFSKQVESLIEEQGEAKARIAMLTALMRLRQICSDPAAVPGVQFDEKPVKVEHFTRSLEEHLENGESVIVFTQFLSTLGRLEGELKRMGTPHYILQGKISAKDRLKTISEFQNNPEPAVMLMTLKTGGVGLNLTKASVVYHLEPWWNPAVENQASDRAHRMGQTKEVTVYNLLIEGSLEERIADLKSRKQGSFDRLFNQDENVDEAAFDAGNALTKEDFFHLLK